MHLLPLLFLLFLLITNTLSQHIIRGEKTRSTLSCPIPNALWFGPTNQTILTNSYKYQIKYLLDHVQLTIDYLTSFDEGEYICINNETNHIIKRYQLKLGTIKNVRFFFVLCNSSLLLLIPIFWYLGKKYSGLQQENSF